MPYLHKQTASRWARIIAALHCTEPSKDPGAAKIAMVNAADFIIEMQDKASRLERLAKEFFDE